MPALNYLLTSVPVQDSRRLICNKSGGVERSTRDIARKSVSFTIIVAGRFSERMQSSISKIVVVLCIHTLQLF